MSHYEKIAFVIVRAAGCCLIVYSLIAVVYVLILALARLDRAPLSSLLTCLPYLLIGVALFALARSLAALILKGVPND